MPDWMKTMIAQLEERYAAAKEVAEKLAADAETARRKSVPPDQYASKLKEALDELRRAAEWYRTEEWNEPPL